jgi:hypothetical protein
MEQIKRIDSDKVKKELSNSLPKGAVIASIAGLIYMVIEFLLSTYE